MTLPARARLIIPDFGEREAFEAASRGYLGSAQVELQDGRRFGVVFYDAVRLAQDLASEAAEGRPFVAERGLVVVTEVTMENMTKAIEQLALGGYFDHLVPESS